MPEMKPEKVFAVQDTREQLPYDLKPFNVIVKGLKSGDYSLLGFEDKVSIERKTLADFVGSISHGRDRFEREVERLQSFESKVILVEGSAADIANHRYQSQMHPNSVMGTIAKYAAVGIPVMLACDRKIAQDFARRFLFLCAKYRMSACEDS